MSVFETVKHTQNTWLMGSTRFRSIELLVDQCLREGERESEGGREGGKKKERDRSVAGVSQEVGGC